MTQEAGGRRWAWGGPANVKPPKSSRPIIGWREWVELVDLAVPAIKAKVDTGARTSVLHAFNMERFEQDGRAMVRFDIHPFQRTTLNTVNVAVPLAGERHIRNSGGHQELRPVIHTRVALLGKVWVIDVTLTNRDLMGFRMLLGRQAVRGRFFVDPGRSYLDRAQKNARSKPTRWKKRA